MDAEIDSEKPEIDGKAIVYLADKMVKENMFVHLKERFAESIESFSGKPDAIASIMRRQETALMIMDEIEKVTGLSDLETVLQNGVIRR